MRKIFYLFVLFLTLFIAKASSFGDSPQMSDYCYSPPSIAQNVKPNVLFVMDFSGSMQFPTYVPCDFSGYDNQKVAQCGTDSSNYDSSKTYYGYFAPDKCYEYSSSFFQEKSCDCSNKIGTNSCISGNLLNWVTTTRIDVARKVLTGGRSSSSGGNTFLESEGAEYTIQDSNLKCKFAISATGTDNRNITISDYYGSCPLGNNSINNANIKIKVSNPSSITGIIHSFCDTSNLNGQINEKCKIIMEFMVFASDNREGVIRVGKNATISNLISAINNETPYWGTPTGEALWEAYDYYKQSNDHNYEANSAYINKDNGNVDPYYDGSGANSIPVYCRKSFVLLLSDGAWNGDVDPVKPAKQMHIEDLRNDLQGKQTVETYAVYAFGDLDPNTKLEGRQAMITTAIFGGFEDKDNNTWPYPFTDYPSSSRKVTYPLSSCIPSSETWNLSCSEWDTYNNSPQDGLPYNFYEADDAESLKSALLNALLDILRRASSGSAVATLASRTGISSLVIQPYYYPKYLTETGTEISWLGFLRSFWMDLKQNLREDTVANKILDMAESTWDKIIQFVTSDNETKIAVLQGDTDSGSNACTLENFKDLNQIEAVFDSGCWLAENSPSARKIKFNKDGTLTTLSTSEASYFAGIWKNIDSNIDSTKASCIIRYLSGEDLSNDSTCKDLDYVKRPRELNINSFCSINDTKTWKLGDIIFSTPSVVSDQPVNIYHIKYGDSTYADFIKSSNYKNRPSLTFVGANDGMLHAFRVGTIINQADPEKPSKLQNAPDDTGTDKIGQEEWAFIPKNAIPYLIWYGKSDYCHVPTVDYRTFVFDAKVNGEWKTLLVGSMGFGGKVLGSYSSSVFVLDITDPLNPSLQWENALPDKTLTLSFPAVTKIGSNWYVVIGSGPKDPDGTQFSTAKIYFFNLSNGDIVNTLTIKEQNSDVTAAVGDIMPVDVDFDYSDDAIYFGIYTTNSGDFYRITLKSGSGYKSVGSLTQNDIIKAVSVSSPVFAAPNFTLDEFGKLWVFFGTGRYLTQADKTISYNNYLIGFKDPCWNGSCSNTYSKNTLTDRTNTTVTATVTEVKKMCSCDSSGCGLVDVVYDTTSGTSVPEPTNGWYYQLTGESIISQPAVFGGNVDALSFVPPADICAYGGSSNLLALYYKTGAPNPRPAVLSRLVTSDTSGNVTVYSKISIGSGAPPFGNPFQITQGISSREYTKFIQVSAGAVLRVEQQVSPGYESRFISWIEK